MSTELIQAEDLKTAMTLARAFYASGYFKDIASEAQALTKILLGRDFGLPPGEALRALNVIKGKPGFDSSWIAGKIKGSGKYDFEILELTNERCLIRFTQNGKPLNPDSEFTMEDAKTAGLLSSDMYRKYPRNMLFARALTNGARWHCSEVFNGAVYTADELRGGEVVEVITPVRELEQTPSGAYMQPPITVQQPSPPPPAERASDKWDRITEQPNTIDNPWLHVLEGVEHDGRNLCANAGKRLHELPAAWFTKAQSPTGQKLLSERDKRAVNEALANEHLRGEALALHDAVERAEVSFADDEIPAKYLSTGAQ